MLSTIENTVSGCFYAGAVQTCLHGRCSNKRQSLRQLDPQLLHVLPTSCLDHLAS
jgi:hypothetical protein